MGDETPGLGDNLHEAELKRRVERRIEILDRIDEHKESLKIFRAEDKADGYTEKVIAAVVRETRKDAEYRALQLQLELELRTYRRACGLPTDLAEAQRLAAEEAEQLPDAEADNDDEPDGSRASGTTPPRKDLN